MKHILKSSMLISAAVASMALASACSSGDDDSNGSSGGSGGSSSGGTSGSGGTGNTGSCTPGGNTVLIPGPTGWIDKTDLCNDVGVQGAWYPYGDQYGNGNGAQKCTKWGGHMASECAQITTPDPMVMAFPNMNGEMHTEGTAEKILPCIAGTMAATIPTSGCSPLPGTDYSSMWGAGIGFDLNADKGEDGGAKHTWDPDMYGVIGIQFTIQGAPPALRVEFPMQLLPEEAAADTPPVTTMPPTTDDHSAGAPYWGALKNGTGMYPASPVVEGVNRITWDQVAPPKTTIYPFDRHRILGIQWHVPTSTGGASMYSFTISNVTFLRN